MQTHNEQSDPRTDPARCSVQVAAPVRLPLIDSHPSLELIEELRTSRRNAIANAELVAADHPDHHLIQQTWREIARGLEEQLASLGYSIPAEQL